MKGKFLLVLVAVILIKLAIVGAPKSSNELNDKDSNEKPDLKYNNYNKYTRPNVDNADERISDKCTNGKYKLLLNK